MLLDMFFFHFHTIKIIESWIKLAKCCLPETRIFEQIWFYHNGKTLDIMNDIIGCVICPNHYTLLFFYFLPLFGNIPN